VRTPRLLASLPLLALAILPAQPAGAGTWHRPDESLTAIAAGDYEFLSLAYYVEAAGHYVVDSTQAYDGFLVVYGTGFDPAAPLALALVANDDGPGGPGTSRVELDLLPGVIYHFVMTTKEPIDIDIFELNSFGLTLTGPGEPTLAACFWGDEVPFADLVPLQDLALGAPANGLGRFCVSARWWDFQGGTGYARPVGFRTRDSGIFEFFGSSNWELTVKVLDGCGVNQKFWVFLTGATNLHYEVTIYDLASGEERVYETEAGAPSPAFVDTDAFATCDAFWPD
jgi:hypothetical protein